ncbi:hypothetical protein SAMN04488519_102275 [Algoriphagus ornithinivorans]|uniref:Uncharacterized protein n=1 Tax=Algoriphagus ornithinivorans TaxID=226506 RepID=A0A1I5CH29_9BACT|nr:hypothetical protein SAMN04488519_102275 [Algoriphagus ornithinivorans]
MKNPVTKNDRVFFMKKTFVLAKVFRAEILFHKRKEEKVPNSPSFKNWFF